MARSQRGRRAPLAPTWPWSWWEKRPHDAASGRPPGQSHRCCGRYPPARAQWGSRRSGRKSGRPRSWGEPRSRRSCWEHSWRRSCWGAWRRSAAACAAATSRPDPTAGTAGSRASYLIRSWHTVPLSSRLSSQQVYPHLKAALWAWKLESSRTMHWTWHTDGLNISRKILTLGSCNGNGINDTCSPSPAWAIPLEVSVASILTNVVSLWMSFKCKSWTQSDKSLSVAIWQILILQMLP